MPFPPIVKIGNSDVVAFIISFMIFIRLKLLNLIDIMKNLGKHKQSSFNNQPEEKKYNLSSLNAKLTKTEPETISNYYTDLSELLTDSSEQE